VLCACHGRVPCVPPLCHLESEPQPGALLRVPCQGHPAGAVYAARGRMQDTRSWRGGPTATTRQSGSGACKSEPRDTRPLTHREGTRATADQEGGLIRRVCCRPPHCFPAAVPLRAVAGGRGGVQEGPPLVQEGSRKGPPCKGLHAPASIARTRGCGGWRRRLGVMTERENLTPSPRREDDWRRAPWCSRPRCWAPLLEEGSELPTRRGGQCLAGCWRGAWRNEHRWVLSLSASL